MHMYSSGADVRPQSRRLQAHLRPPAAGTDDKLGAVFLSLTEGTCQSVLLTASPFNGPHEPPLSRIIIIITITISSIIHFVSRLSRASGAVPGMFFGPSVILQPVAQGTNDLTFLTDVLISKASGAATTHAGMMTGSWRS